MLHLLERACATVERAFSVLTVLLLSLTMGINALEIVGRTFFHYSFQWIYETNLLFAVWIYFLGIYLVYRRSGDIAMMVLVARLSSRARAVYDRALQVLIAAIFLGLAWYGWDLVVLQWPFRTPGVGFPRAAFTIPLLLGAAMIGLDAARRALGGAAAPAHPLETGEAA